MILIYCHCITFSIDIFLFLISILYLLKVILLKIMSNIKCEYSSNDNSNHNSPYERLIHSSLTQSISFKKRFCYLYERLSILKSCNEHSCSCIPFQKLKFLSPFISQCFLTNNAKNIN